MGKYYVYSTLSQDVKYASFTKQEGEYTPRVLRSVTINGGAGVINKRLLTPKGIVTQISEEEHLLLKGGESVEPNHVFARHEKAGFVKIEKKNAKLESVVKDMQAKDGSAQKTEKDFKNAGTAETAVHSVG